MAAQSIIFVVDGKGLEAMSLVLAASIARWHDRDEVQAIAYVSEPTLPNLSPATLALYQACGVQIAPLASAKGMWRKPYPHGNKIIAAASPRTSRRTTFLDTDIVLQGCITDIEPADSHEVFVVPEGKPTWGKEGDAWARAYAFFDLPLPTERVTLMRGRRKQFLPYFNAGVISFSDLPLDGDKPFGAVWLEMARRFDWECAVANKRPWLDQITLPLVMAYHGLGCATLPEVYNYSVSERADLSQVHLAKVVHYHRAMYFNALPNAAEHLEAVRQRVPAALREELETLLTLYTQTPARDYSAKVEDEA